MEEIVFPINVNLLVKLLHMCTMGSCDLALVIELAFRGTLKVKKVGSKPDQ